LISPRPFASCFKLINILKKTFYFFVKNLIDRFAFWNAGSDKVIAPVSPVDATLEV
jgi:hypothetical protein